MAVGGCCVSSFGRVALTPSHPFLEEGIPFCGHRGQSARDWNGTGGPRGYMVGVAAAWTGVLSLEQVRWI